MSDDDDVPMMPNREHVVLEEMLEFVRGQRDALASALDWPLQIMADGEAWTGPNRATEFTEDLERRRNELVNAVDQLIDQICAELRATPDEVPVHEWDQAGLRSS